MAESGRELVRADDNPHFSSARANIDGTTLSEEHQAAVRAGFREWLAGCNPYTLKFIGEGAREALNMPFPNRSVTDAWADAGFEPGATVKPRGSWSLGIARSLSETEPYDIGVRLVAVERVAGQRGGRVRLPLDLTITRHSYYEAATRPDKVMVEVGEGQLSRSRYFSDREAQQLLIMAGRFIEIVGSLGSPEARETLMLPAADRKHRFLGRLNGSR